MENDAINRNLKGYYYSTIGMKISSDAVVFFSAYRNSSFQDQISDCLSESILSHTDCLHSYPTSYKEFWCKNKATFLHIMPDHMCSPQEVCGRVCTNMTEQPLSVAINACSPSPHSCLPATLWAPYPDVNPPREPSLWL